MTKRPMTLKELQDDLFNRNIVGRQKADVLHMDGALSIARYRGVPTERDATPPPKRPMTSRELADSLIENGHLDKTRGDWLVSRNKLDELKSLSNKKGLGTERDATPPPNSKMSASEKAIYDFNERVEKEQAAEAAKKAREEAEAKKAREEAEAAKTPEQRRKEAHARERKEAQATLAGMDLSVPVGKKSPAKVKIDALEKAVIAGEKANPRAPLNPHAPLNTRSTSRSASRASGTPGRRATFASSVPEAPTATPAEPHSSSRPRSGTPSQRASREAMHDFAERERASSVSRARVPNNSYIPSDAWESPYVYETPLSAEERIKKMEEELSSTPRTIGSQSDEHKNIMELAHKEYKRPHHVWRGNPVAKLSPLQREYRQILKEDSPYSVQAQEERGRSIRALTPYLTDNTPMEISEPYVKQMTRNPSEFHEELMGPTEREHIQSIRDEGEEHFNKKILPGIHARYQVPGLLQHGHMRSDINEAAERYGKGLNSAIAQHKGSFRNMTLGASQKHAAMQGQAANLMSNAAQSGRANNLEAFGALKEIKKQDRLEKNLFTSKLESAGVQDRTRDQDRINEQKNRFNEAQEAPLRKIGQLADLSNKYQHAAPIALPKRIPSSSGQVERELASVGMGAAGTLFNQAMNPQQQVNRGHHKKGGRVKKAYGGIVNPAETAIENSIVQKTNPIYELRRLLNMPDPVQQYATGGLVNPIQAGAQEAQQYAGHAAMQNKLQRMRQPAPQIGIMGALADATGDGSGEGWLGRSLKSFHAGYSRQDQRREAQQQRVDAADDLEYRLQAEIEAKAQQEKAMALKERLANAQIGHIGAQNAHLGLQGEKLRHEMNGIGSNTEDSPTKIQKASDLRLAKEAHEGAKSKIAAIERVRLAADKLDKVKTGRWPGALNKYTLGLATSTDTNDAEDAANAALTAVKKANPSGRQTNMLLAADQASKIQLSSSKKSNKENAEITMHELQQGVIEDVMAMKRAGEPRSEIRRVLAAAGLTEDDLVGHAHDLSSSSSDDVNLGPKRNPNLYNQNNNKLDSVFASDPVLAKLNADLAEAKRREGKA